LLAVIAVAIFGYSSYEKMNTEQYLPWSSHTDDDRVVSRTLRWKRRFGRAWKTLAQQDATGPRYLVLRYQSFGGSRFAVSPENFAQQMHYLAEHAQAVGLDELLKRPQLERICCAITFDGGYESVLEAALPVLRQFGFPATLYLPTDAIHATVNLASDDFPGLCPSDRMLTWRQVGTLAGSGISIGSQLLQHRDLTKLEPRQAFAELSGSKQTIEERVGSPCRDFSYPRGLYDWTAVDWVRAAGYRTAVTRIHGPWSPYSDPLLIPRMEIRPEYTLEDFAAVLRGDWDYLGWWQFTRQHLSA
jgi:peptidoglycan/xylan/chitin deacetylase (PgdA/CDA1 family)